MIREFVLGPHHRRRALRSGILLGCSAEVGEAVRCSLMTQFEVTVRREAKDGAETRRLWSVTMIAVHKLRDQLITFERRAGGFISA